MAKRKFVNKNTLTGINNNATLKVHTNSNPTNSKLNIQKKIAFTTAISPQNRASLEVSAIENDNSIANILNTALDYYFSKVKPINNEDLFNTFNEIYERKIK